MGNDNKDFYIATSDGRTGAAKAYLYGLIESLDRNYKDMSINLTVWEGQDPTGTIVAERIDGEWCCTDD